MNGVRQGWLVARREMRERSRSRAFRVSLVLMVVTVAATLILPALLRPDSGTRDVGLTGAAPPALAAAIGEQAQAAGITARVHRYASLAAGEQATRQGRVDVLVAGAQRLEWPGQADQQLRAVVTGAIQLVTVRERATAAGLRPGAAAALLAPVPVTNAELGHVAGRSPGDETAVMVMTLVLFFGISLFGAMVLTRTLLAGKITGIGLLGLAQIAATALAALAAVAAVPSIHLPAVRGAVLAWAVVWFMLGYALYATVYGALGSLGSRAEDAQAVAGPVMVILPVAYFASFLMIAQPTSATARAISYFPLTAPMAMPGRIAMGGAAWWEPAIAAVLTLATTIGLVLLAGRIYANAILHGGPRLSLRDAWPRAAAPALSTTKARTRAATTTRHKARAMTGGRTIVTKTDLGSHRWLITVLTGVGVVLGVAVGVLTSDVIIGVIAGAGFIAITIQMVKLWTGRSGPPIAHQ